MIAEAAQKTLAALPEDTRKAVAKMLHSAMDVVVADAKAAQDKGSFKVLDLKYSDAWRKVAFEAVK
jgi:phage-related protein